METGLPLIVIVGPTASGKTSLAIKVAQKYNGEIICADSRTVYKHMDIGTAKPSYDEQHGVPHWGLDLVLPGERFSVADFKDYALKTIDDIRRRGKLPIIVGGTGLYVDAIIFDYNFEQASGKLTRNAKLIANTVVVGIATTKEVLIRRINDRAEQLFENGVVEEAKMLGEKYGWINEAMTGNVYPLVQQYVLGNITDSELKERFKVADRQLAKRQMTWFRANPYVEWVVLKDAESYIGTRLAPE